MRALSIRQPYVEEILRGIKTVEFRNRPTTIIGETFYIYAALKAGEGLDIPRRFAALGCGVGDLPTGVIVGTAKISHVTGARKDFRWHLIEVKRLTKARKPRKHPQPSWFDPF